MVEKKYRYSNFREYKSVLVLLLAIFLLLFLINEEGEEVTVTFDLDVRLKDDLKESHRKNVSNIIRTLNISRRTIEVIGRSSEDEVYIVIDKNMVYKHVTKTKRGIHLIIINEYNGEVMDTKIFDTFSNGIEIYMAEYLRTIRDGMLLVFLVLDEASMNLKDVGRHAIRSLGSVQIDTLGWRGMWAFVSKGKKSLYEKSSPSIDGNTHGNPIIVNVTLSLEPKSKSCKYGNSFLQRKRRAFCFRYVGYESLCNCVKPSPIQFNSPRLPGNKLTKVPITIMASNRPHYLYIMLSKLLSTPGVDHELITVYIDGFNDQVIALLDLLRIKFVEHPPFCAKGCRIQQSYKFSLYDTFDKYPNAEYVLILEEDLIVSEDIMDYFSQLLPILESDESVYCISAWNANSYNHSAHDPASAYRVEGMPGLGWILKRDLFIKELGPKWPHNEVIVHWDMWMRFPHVRNDRECIIPDISRTFHIGKIGTHMNGYMYDYVLELFATKLNTKTGNIFDITKLTKNGYEEHVHEVIKNAQVLDHSINPCNNSTFIPDTKGHTYVMYIRWAYKGDTETWFNIARCFKIFNADVRGFHKLMWRFWIKQNHLLVVGSTSPYMIYKAADITPIYISNSMVGRTDEVFDMLKYQGYTI